MRPSKILPLIMPTEVRASGSGSLQVSWTMLLLRENYERGRFMRITEEAHGRRNTIIIPSTGLDDFMSAAGEVIQSAERVPAAS